MPTQVTIDDVAYTIERLQDGNIRVTHLRGQSHPMLGPGTDGIHVFQVHPCQTRWYAYWSAHLPSQDPETEGPGQGGERPWWSSKGWKRPQREKE